MSNSSLTGRLREYDEFSLIANKAMKDLQAEMESESITSASP